VGGVVLHFRPRNDNGARRRGGGGGGIAAGAGCEDHVAVWVECGGEREAAMGS